MKADQNPTITKTNEKSTNEKSPTAKTAAKETLKKGTEKRKEKFSKKLSSGKLHSGKLPTGRMQTGVLKKYINNKATEKPTNEKPSASTTKPSKASHETHEQKSTSQSNQSKTKPATKTAKTSDHPQNLTVLQTFSKSDKSPLHLHFTSNVIDREVSFAARRSGILYRVYQRNDIDWNRVRTSKKPESFCGKTNLEAALKGIAPELADGSIVNLHHVNQNAFGPLVEVSSSIHNRSNKNRFSALHGLFDGSKNPEFPVDHSVFNADRVEYWKSRAAEVKSKLNK